MDLSIIIVNYNVRYFLEHCLRSVQSACNGIEAEVIVVDNNSVDGSVEMLREKFPWVQTIASKENLGFSKGNNLGIQKAKGRYLLLLNPDTVVEEDTFRRCIEYMDDHPKAGGLGVKMMDGSGAFLPESKRGLPTPDVAFYKIFGLSALFPKSRTFGKYHLSYLDQDTIASIEVLSGAYMFLRKSVIDQIGGLDENFFMYGEDIDLSYRIVKAGYENIYFPETRIIHYKGESTKKSSVNYVFVFYRAMIIFARKHFADNKARLLSFLINLAIYFRAGVAIVSRLTNRLALPALDFGLMFGVLIGLKSLYESQIKSGEGVHYPPEVDTYGFPIMLLIWILSISLLGGYNRPVRMLHLLRGLVLGSVVILIGYALLDESMRFSRGLILLSTVASVLILPLLRLLLDRFGVITLDRNQEKRVGIVGSATEIKRIRDFLRISKMPVASFYYINPKRKSESPPDGVRYHASLYQLRDVVDIHKINELILCLNDISVESAIAQMSNGYRRKVNFMLAPRESEYVIGSSSNRALGEYYLIDTHALLDAGNQRKKRLFDLAAALLLLLLSPVLIFAYRSPGRFLKNMRSIVLGNSTFVGIPTDIYEKANAAPIVQKPHLITAADQFEKMLHIDRDDVLLNYLANYSVSLDLDILMRGLKNLDRTPV